MSGSKSGIVQPSGLFTVKGDHDVSDGEDALSDGSERGRSRGRSAPWGIDKKGTDALFKFDGKPEAFRLWRSHMRDHISEEWEHWLALLFADLACLLLALVVCERPVATVLLKLRQGQWLTHTGEGHVTPALDA